MIIQLSKLFFHFFFSFFIFFFFFHFLSSFFFHIYISSCLSIFFLICFPLGLGSPGKPVSQYDDSNKDSSDEELEYSHHHPLSKKEFRSKIISLIAEENWSNLMEFDELNRELLAGRVLPGFTAPMPAFPPTFKRVRNKKIELLQDHSNTGMYMDVCYFLFLFIHIYQLFYSILFYSFFSFFLFFFLLSICIHFFCFFHFIFFFYFYTHLFSLVCSMFSSSFFRFFHLLLCIFFHFLLFFYCALQSYLSIHLLLLYLIILQSINPSLIFVIINIITNKSSIFFSRYAI